MRFFLLAVLLTYTTVSLFQFVIASPVTLPEDMVKRAPKPDGISGVLSKLDRSLSVILPQIDQLVQTKTANQANVEPLIGQVVAALNTAHDELVALTPTQLIKRQSTKEIAQLVSKIITNIATTLNGLLQFASTIPLLGVLLSGVDRALNQVLLGLSILLKGVLKLVAVLLANVAQLLRNLGLSLTLGALGL
ncbi:Sc15 protein [Ceratobasidium theobromae]|uniref:Sc15 protein n=1 Tax=Ceratobasidium theobromae TaxID=1582974 RepID=A0A5N5QDS2_9AGAM|nr:Sc15 protein [Ceratobasidium theobromae]